MPRLRPRLAPVRAAPRGTRVRLVPGSPRAAGRRNPAGRTSARPGSARAAPSGARVRLAPVRPARRGGGIRPAAPRFPAEAAAGPGRLPT